MDESRRLAARIDQHMQRLAAQGVSETQAIINHMVGYVPDLHTIWGPLRKRIAKYGKPARQFQQRELPVSNLAQLRSESAEARVINRAFGA